MPELTNALASVGVNTRPIHISAHTAAFGAARTTEASPSPTTPASPGRAATSALSVTVAWAAAATLAYQMFASATAYPKPNTPSNWLFTQMWAWGVAGLFITLGAVSMALLTAHLRHRRAASPTDPDPALGSSLLAAALTGLIASAALALIGAQHFAVEVGPLLRWTLGSTTPLATALTAIGIIAARYPSSTPAGASPAPWRDQLRLPLIALIPAALSTVLVAASLVGVPATYDGRLWNVQHAGGFLLGWAITWLLPIRWTLRLIIGLPLAWITSKSISTETAGALASCLIATLTLWWLIQLARAIRGSVVVKKSRLGHPQR